MGDVVLVRLGGFESFGVAVGVGGINHIPEGSPDCAYAGAGHSRSGLNVEADCLARSQCRRCTRSTGKFTRICSSSEASQRARRIQELPYNMVMHLHITHTLSAVRKGRHLIPSVVSALLVHDSVRGRKHSGLVCGNSLPARLTRRRIDLFPMLYTDSTLFESSHSSIECTMMIEFLKI